jgi:hypothetical protein
MAEGRRLVNDYISGSGADCGLEHLSDRQPNQRIGKALGNFPSS